MILPKTSQLSFGQTYVSDNSTESDTFVYFLPINPLIKRQQKRQAINQRKKADWKRANGQFFCVCEEDPKATSTICHKTNMVRYNWPITLFINHMIRNSIIRFVCIKIYMLREINSLNKTKYIREINYWLPSQEIPGSPKKHISHN